MRTEVITKQVFQFAELSEAAKENAREWWREAGQHDEWWHCTVDDAKTCAALLGVDIDRVYFSGFSSQGDGACFEGSYRYAKGWRKALRSHVGGDSLKELEEIGEALQQAQKAVFYGATASTWQSGHYMHSGCMTVSVDVEEHPRGGYWDDTSAVEEGITDALRLLADWIYSQLEREYDYLNSDDAVEESIEANDYEFDVNGAIH